MPRLPGLLLLLAVLPAACDGAPPDPDRATSAATCVVASTAAYVETVRTCLRPVVDTDTHEAAP